MRKTQPPPQDKGNPLPVFKTNRLFLRGLRLSDAENYEKHFACYEIMQYLRHTAPHPYPKGGAEDWLKSLILPEQGTNRWAWGLFLKENPKELIGCIELRRKGSPGNRGFWLATEYQGKGLMTEACRPVLDYAFEELGFDKLIFDNAVENTASRRVKEKTACRFIELRPQKFINPKFTESEIWELTKKRWLEFRNKKPVRSKKES